ncbi:MAG: DUF3189 family protein [Bacillota bacterium]|jgi:hypothetical protein
MKIIFYSYSGVHSAVVAGAAYLGILSSQKAASLQFSGVPFFGCKENKFQLKYLGNDKKGNQIYALGVKGELELLPRSIKKFLELINIPPHDLIMINTYVGLSSLSRWGEKLATWGFITLGNFMVRQGLKKDFPHVWKDVQLILDSCQS